MQFRVRRYLLPCLLALAVVLSSLGVTGGLQSVRAGGGPSGAVAGATGGSSTAGTLPAAQNLPVATSAAAVSSAGPTADIGQSVLRSAEAAHVSARDVFPPRPSATPAQIARTDAGAPVTPLYTSSPAPMGLAYFGLNNTSAGGVFGTVLNTTALRATVDTNGKGVRSLDLFQTSPDGYGIQLNAVLTNVSLFGTGGYSFWTQNVVEVFPDTGIVVIVTNVWNFSSPNAVLSGNALLFNGITNPAASDGPNASNEYGLLGFYYGEEQISPSGAHVLSSPFNLTLYLNSTIRDHRDAVAFGIALTSANLTFRQAAWDYVVFNSTKPAGQPDTVPSNYTADGLHYDPLGLTNDFELIFGGPGGGSQSTLFDADATLGLAYNDSGSFVSVPAAFNYGGETGETVTGANIAWNRSLLGGPDGDQTFGTMTTGPSFLTGLWNATSSPGSYALTLSTTPVNAISIVTPTSGNPHFAHRQPAVAPNAFTDVFDLAPGTYSVETELSGYAPVTNLVNLSTGPVPLSITLTPDLALGVYTPLWAFSNAGVAALNQSGNGTTSNPYVLLNAQPAALGVAFGLYNDFAFPVYPGVFLYRTSVATEILDPPSFSTATNAAQSPALPVTNDLQYWFWGVTNVSIVGASNISGWFASTTYDPTFFNTFSVVFYESSHNLIASNTFDSEGQGVALFAGGILSLPLAAIGGNNTVWGNRFSTVPAPPSPVHPLLPVAAGLGIEIAEPDDVVYNNFVASATTAFQVPMNIYTSVPQFFHVTWNISRQPASAVHFASGFPLVALTGSIIGTSYQGGNFWWDYGLGSNPYNGANDPYNLFPYEERAITPILSLFGPSVYYLTYIFPGGDFVPLSNVSLYPVVFNATPIDPGMIWGVNVSSGSIVYDNFTAVIPTHTVYLPNGSYSYHGVGVVNYTRTSGAMHPFTVAAAEIAFKVAFHLARGVHPVSFHRVGLVAKTPWAITVNGTSPSTDVDNASWTTTTAQITFALRAGSYSFSVAHVPGYTVNRTGGALTVGTTGQSVHLRFTLYRYAVTFTETGLPSGARWTVTVDRQTRSSTTSSIVFQIPNGTFAFTVHHKSGFVTTQHGNVTVAGAPVIVDVTFTAGALPAASTSEHSSAPGMARQLGTLIATAAAHLRSVLDGLL